MGDSDGPPDHRPRSCRPHGVSGGLGGADGVLAPLVGVTTALLSPLPPRPWHPTHASLLRGARRHVQRLPRPTSPSRPPPRPRRWPRRPRRSPCGSFGSRAPSLSRPRCSPRPTPRPSGRRRRQGVTSAPPEHLPGGQRLRSGAGGPCEPAGATSEYSKARASPLSPARRVSLTTPPPPGSGVHRAYKMAAGRAPARLSLWPERWVTPWPGSGPLGLLRAARCASPPPHGRAPAPHTPTPPQDRSGDTGRPPRAAPPTIPTPRGGRGGPARRKSAPPSLSWRVPSFPAPRHSARRPVAVASQPSVRYCQRRPKQHHRYQRHRAGAGELCGPYSGPLARRPGTWRPHTAPRPRLAGQNRRHRVGTLYGAPGLAEGGLGGAGWPGCPPPAVRQASGVGETISGRRGGGSDARSGCWPEDVAGSAILGAPVASSRAERRQLVAGAAGRSGQHRMLVGVGCLGV